MEGEGAGRVELDGVACPRKAALADGHERRRLESMPKPEDE